MKIVLRCLVVAMLTTTLMFSPAITSMAKAGGINFEGISPIKTEDTQSYEKQPRGLMLNFSFGAPKGYKKTKSLSTMLDENEDVDVGKGVLTGVLVGTGVIVLIIIFSDKNKIIKNAL